jgi:hypothetical protein
MEKAFSITYSDCVNVELVIHYTMRMGHIVICGLSRCTALFHTVLNSKICGERVTERKTCV